MISFLEKLLILLLPSRDRETVSGDLLEEYREEQLPQHGRLRANFWYLQQVVSFMNMKKILIPFCVFGLLAGTWLGVMENVLKHDGYAGRTVIAACIALQALITLLPVERLRIVVMPGAVAIIWLGFSSISTMLHGPHFEGFVLIIGAGLMLQGALTLAALLQNRNRVRA
jgi:hypothetical protein